MMYSPASVFVYLTDALDNDHGPHTYIPFTQDVIGPPKGTFQASGYDHEEDYDRLVEAFALSLSSQVLPEEYLKANLFNQKTSSLFGKKGTVWIEDTHIFHKAESTKKDWRGLLMIDYTATGYCGKDHTAFHQALSTIPQTLETQDALKTFPRLFQRMNIGQYNSPNPRFISSDIPARLLDKVETLEDRFGTLMYDKTVQDRNPTSHKEYVDMGYKDAGDVSWPADQPLRGIPCWEYECFECLNGHGTCGYCENSRVCTCTCSEK